MSDDHTFRLTLIVLLAIFSPYAMYCRARSRTKEKLDRWQEGWVILFGLRLGAIPVAVTMLLWMIEPAWMKWGALPLPNGLRWIGVVINICAGGLLWWTFYNLGRNLTDTVVTRAEHTLVTSGPYQYVRHPFYATFMLGLLGTSLAMANWFVPLLGLIPLAFIIVRTRIEEEKLIARFGNDYRRYMQRVGRFVPRIGRR